jgi:hypothetical protein
VRHHLAVPPESSSYEWFSEWVDQHLALTLTLAQQTDTGGLMAAFGASAFDRGELPFDEAEDLDVDVVRMGTTAGWTYAMEHFTVRGGDPDWLAGLSSAGGLAVSACFTETISSVLVARDGVLVTCFDVVCPNLRFGSDEHAFDGEMRAAGFPDDGPTDRRGEPVARFLELVTGVGLSEEMLEGSLLCATLP